MQLTIQYILSQIFTISMYVFMGISYFSKNKKNIIILNTIGSILILAAYFCLSAYTGMTVIFIAIIRNMLIYLCNNKRDYYINKDMKNEKYLKKISKYEILILIATYISIIIAASFTYNGVLSLFSVIATAIFSFSIWQKNNFVYRILGLFTNISWIIYNIYINSFFGVILESILFIVTLVSVITYKKRINSRQI